MNARNYYFQLELDSLNNLMFVNVKNKANEVSGSVYTTRRDKIKVF